MIAAIYLVYTISQALREAIYIYFFAATLDIIIMTLHNRKLSHREVKKIVHGHLALYCLRSIAIKITCSLILKVFSLLNVC